MWAGGWCDDGAVRIALTAVLALIAAAAGCSSKKPPAGTCEAVGAHVLSLFSPPDAYSRDVSAAMATRCREDVWTPAMRACVLGTTSVTQPKGCRAQLTPDQVTKLDASIAAAERAQENRTIPDVCIRYEALVEKAQGCDAVPLALRTSLKDKLAAAKATWDALDSTRGLTAICSSALQSVRPVVSDCPGAATW